MEYNFTTQGFISLLNTDEKEAVRIINEILEKDITTREVIDHLGCSWTSIQPALEEKGYKKQHGRGKGIIKMDDKGEIEMKDKPTTKVTLTNEEILFVKDLFKNRDNTTKELDIRIYDDYKQRSFLVAEELLKNLDDVYDKNKKYKKQDIFNEILRRGLDSFK